MSDRRPAYTHDVQAMTTRAADYRPPPTAAERLDAKVFSRSDAAAVEAAERAAREDPRREPTAAERALFGCYLDPRCEAVGRRSVQRATTSTGAPALPRITVEKIEGRRRKA